MGGTDSSLCGWITLFQLTLLSNLSFLSDEGLTLPHTPDKLPLLFCVVSKCSETHLQSVLHKTVSASNTDMGDFEELKIIFRLIYLIYFLYMSILPHVCLRHVCGTHEGIRFPNGVLEGCELSCGC